MRRRKRMRGKAAGRSHKGPEGSNGYGQRAGAGHGVGGEFLAEAADRASAFRQANIAGQRTLTSH